MIPTATEIAALSIGALGLAYLFGVNVGHKAGRGYEQYLASLEKLKENAEAQCCEEQAGGRDE